MVDPGVYTDDGGGRGAQNDDVGVKKLLVVLFLFFFWSLFFKISPFYYDVSNLKCRQMFCSPVTDKRKTTVKEFIRFITAVTRSGSRGMIQKTEIIIK